MCANCASTLEVGLVQAAFAAYVLGPRVHRRLAALGLAPEPDPVAHEVRTVAFLESLDLDPVEILGPEAVARAVLWNPQPTFIPRWRRSASPIGSQRALATQ